MKHVPCLSLAILAVALAGAPAPARADDTMVTPPPVLPGAGPDTTPADGTTPPAPRRHMHAGFVLGELKAKLTLTPEQTKSVADILKASHGQIKELRDDGSLSDDDKRAKVREIVGATRVQIRAILTPDQQKIFDALPTRGERPAPPAATPPAQAPPST